MIRSVAEILKFLQSHFFGLCEMLQCVLESLLLSICTLNAIRLFHRVHYSALPHITVKISIQIT